jgi:hypothetical protein
MALIKELNTYEIQRLRELSIRELEAFFVKDRIDAKDQYIYRSIFHHKDWDFLWRSDGGTFVRKKYWKGSFPPWWIKHDFNAQNSEALRENRKKWLYMLDIALVLQQDMVKAGYSWINATVVSFLAWSVGFGVAKR